MSSKKLFRFFGMSADNEVRFQRFAGAFSAFAEEEQMTASYALGPVHDLTFHLPVARPILFAFAFQMLQFEPDITLTHRSAPRGENAFLMGAGLGLSLHNGPDYESDLDNRGPSFFASGPFISGMIGWELNGSDQNKRFIGLRVFYVPLMSTDGPDGKVYGIVFEYTTYF